MLEQFVDSADSYIETNPWLAIAAVLLGGLLTASNPCVLAMIPLTMSFVAGGRQGEGGLLRAMTFSGLFVLGLSITFTALGMIAALAGTIYGDVSGIWNWVVAGVCAVMGLHLMGVLDVPLPMSLNVQPKVRGAVGALVLGGRPFMV